MGKTIGFLLGFMVFGPLGALIGALIGHFYFDAGNSRSAIFSTSSRIERERIFFENLFSMLARLAKADGKIQQSEIDEINRIMVQDLRLDEASRKKAIAVFRRAKEDEKSFDSYAQELATVFRGDRQVLHTLVAILFAVAAADGIITSGEEGMLRQATAIFGLGAGSFEFFRGQFIRTAPMDKHYAILQCKPEDPDRRIKDQYRKLAKEYHPDKIQNKGLPSEFQSFAKEKFQEIQNAYSEICKARGI